MVRGGGGMLRAALGDGGWRGAALGDGGKLRGGGGWQGAAAAGEGRRPLAAQGRRWREMRRGAGGWLGPAAAHGQGATAASEGRRRLTGKGRRAAATRRETEEEGGGRTATAPQIWLLPTCPRQHCPQVVVVAMALGSSRHHSSDRCRAE
ncbi:uncharacterized protein LOC127770533 isoform X2 [Oryza glaberrima]|uniref:uncharacterized protein LOC127770533 isoform X2 n=1 Tax=Oryza glaberrima TaxID=4538 RepID=UPI00224C3079|nr:uncharacterized protein LOC127770533 isoform X2 [Oryza glaberrima]